MLNNLGLVLATQANYAEAEPLYQRALKIAEKALGPDQPTVAGVAENLAVVLRKCARRCKRTSVLPI